MLPFSLQLCNWSVVQMRRSEKGPYVLLCPVLLCKDGISKGSCNLFQLMTIIVSKIK